jgi:hypothetical protein
VFACVCTCVRVCLCGFVGDPALIFEKFSAEEDRVGSDTDGYRCDGSDEGSEWDNGADEKPRRRTSRLGKQSKIANNRNQFSRPKLSLIQRQRKSRAKRRQYTYEFKAKVVYEFDNYSSEVCDKEGAQGTTQRTRDRPNRIDKINEKFGLTQTPYTIDNWISPAGRQKIEAVLGRTINDFVQRPKQKGGRGKKTAGRYILRLVNRRPAKFEQAEANCITWLRKQRDNGLVVTSKTMRKYMVQQVRDIHGSVQGHANFKASQGWLKRFMARHRLGWRMRNDNAVKSAKTLAHAVQKFLKKLQELRSENPDPKDLIWGKFGPRNTLNVDQVPLPFAATSTRTIEFLGTQRVWIKQPGSGLDKRQATLQLMIRAEGKQPKPVLIFRGQKHYNEGQEHWEKKRAEETELYDPDVEVLWQAKSWADTDTCVEWAKGAFKDFVKDEIEGPHLLVVDNLSAQTKDVFVEAIKSSSPEASKLRFGPAGATHLWQPVDHHIGARYKFLMSEAYHTFMINRGDAGELTPAQRRVLLTKWAGEAYRKLEQDREQCEQACAAKSNPDIKERSLFYRAFVRTGCLIDIKGEYEEHIRVHADLPAGKEFFETVFEEPAPVVEQQARVDDSKSSYDVDGGDEEDSEDKDDEPPESDGGLEPIPDCMEISYPVDDDRALIKAAESSIPSEDTQQLLDFRMARRVAEQHATTAVVATFSSVPSDFGSDGRRRSGRARKQLHESYAHLQK